MDPHSYGYNHAIPDDQYMTGEEIVKTLVDIVANNGNFLLDIGPKGDGAIPAIMQTNLRDVGAWIRAHGEAIYGTTYWSVTAGADPWRYTATADAFYVHHIGRPEGKVPTIPDPVPFLPGDCVTAVGGAAGGTKVGSTWTDPGTLKLVLPQSVLVGTSTSGHSRLSMCDEAGVFFFFFFDNSSFPFMMRILSTRVIMV